MKRLLNNSDAALSASADMVGEFVDPSFSAAVIDWQKQDGRHALPWQNTRDAYRIWLSEIMLQQTQVTAVIPYYLKFLDSFPTVQSLAAAPSEQVMAHWSGLGYYTRARNLHRCAQQVVERYAGRVPDDPALLAELPGIGRQQQSLHFLTANGRRFWMGTSSVYLPESSGLRAFLVPNRSRTSYGGAPSRCCQQRTWRHIHKA